MNQALAALLLASVLFVAYMVANFVIFRLLPNAKKWPLLNRLYFAFVPIVFVAAWGWQARAQVITPEFYAGPFWTYLVAGGVLMLLLLNGYLMFYSINDRSLSVRMMVDFYRSQNQALTLAELEKSYDTGASYARRLEILTEAGFLVPEGQRYRLTPKGAKLARAVRWLKEVYGLGPGG